jgi:D-serine dehydratase
MPTIEQVLAETLDATFKGFPTDREPIRVGEAGGAGLRLLAGDLPFPVAVLKESAIRHNAGWFGRFVAETGVSLCPHGKTTLAPQLFAEQLSDGAWGITVANVHQGWLAAQAGAPRVLMANQIASPADARRWIDLARRHPGQRLLTLTDSVDQAAILVRAVREMRGSPLDVLVELGAAGGRTGCRDPAQALALARWVRSAPELRLAGVEAFEGLHVSADPVRDAEVIGAWMESLAALARACDREGLFECDEVLLSAGGSAVFDLVADRLRVELEVPARIVLRSGCYISHDDGVYRRHLEVVARRGLTRTSRDGTTLRGALEVWAAVQSRPEPGLAIVTLGRRDVGTDSGLPQPLHWFVPGRDERPRPAPGHWQVVAHNDQHGYLRVADGDALAVGDWLGFGVSHPCTTFDKWRLIWGVDDGYRVTRAIRTYF